LGGVCEFGASQGLPITEDGLNYAFSLNYRYGQQLKNARPRPAARPAPFGMIMRPKTPRSSATRWTSIPS
jgi:hypothetical protein